MFCQDSQLPLAKLLAASRALITFSTSAAGRREYGPYTPYYIAGYNPRESEVQRDPVINPGTLPTVILHELGPLAGQPDGPLRFYDLRLDPAGDLATGTRVRALSGPFAGLKGTVKHPDFRAPMIDFDAARGRYARQVQRSDLEPGDACTDGHPLRWNADDYDTPRWVHVSVADLAACTSVMAADEADPCDIADAMNGDLTPGSDN